MTEFGRVLRIIRLNSGESAREMAAKLEISMPYLNAIENGRRDIPNGMAEKVAKIYNLSERDQKNLKEALIATKDRVKIDLTELSAKKRLVILALAQDELDGATLEEICKLVNNKNGGDK